MWMISMISRGGRCIDISEENHVAAKCSAAIFGTKFVPCATQKAGQLGKVLAVIRELVSESHSDVAALARVFDIAGDLGELAKRARQIDEARHLRRRFRRYPFLQILAHVGAHLRRSMASSLRYRRIERGTQCVYPQLVDGVAHG